GNYLVLSQFCQVDTSSGILVKSGKKNYDSLIGITSLFPWSIPMVSDHEEPNRRDGGTSSRRTSPMLR
ncbi:hypothetical protein V3C99_014723, partial [Haemonchus contortus]